MNFDPGYRQSVIERFHTDRGALRPGTHTTLQNDVTDDLAVRLSAGTAEGARRHEADRTAARRP
ncbi:hypothetical protein [Streptomyces sp. KL116D]|uniref:hypothetical protein n=1 Tax=Streptomyces sp. KL116D TaxID=3045152 RepID=UPI0035560148